MFRHHRCPARRHICFRGMLAGTLCGVRESWDLALRAARNRHAFETFDDWRVLDELAPPAGWPDRTLARKDGRVITLQDTLR